MYELQLTICKVCSVTCTFTEELFWDRMSGPPLSIEPSGATPMDLKAGSGLYSQDKTAKNTGHHSLHSGIYCSFTFFVLFFKIYGYWLSVLCIVSSLCIFSSPPVLVTIYTSFPLGQHQEQFISRYYNSWGEFQTCNQTIIKYILIFFS